MKRNDFNLRGQTMLPFVVLQNLIQIQNRQFPIDIFSWSIRSGKILYTIID